MENADVSVKIGKNIVCIKKDTSWKMLRLIKMNTNNQFKKKIKNGTCYYLDNIKIEKFELDNISIDEKSYKFFFVFNISYKTLIGELSWLGLIK